MFLAFSDGQLKKWRCFRALSVQSVNSVANDREPSATTMQTRHTIFNRG